LVQEEYAEGFRERIPFEYIELKQWGQFDPGTHQPGGTEYRILLFRDGKAEYEGTTGVKMIGLHRGKSRLKNMVSSHCCLSCLNLIPKNAMLVLR
jgi:hypothetical protein